MIIERLIKYMEIKGLTDSQVTRDCQLSVGLLWKAKAGKNDLSRNTVERICNHYADLNKEWLLYGTGPMLLDPPPESQQPAAAPVERYEGPPEWVTMPREVFELLKTQAEALRNLANEFVRSRGGTIATDSAADGKEGQNSPPLK